MISDPPVRNQGTATQLLVLHPSAGHILPGFASPQVRAVVDAVQHDAATSGANYTAPVLREWQ